jgi:hypothetical protein
LKQHGLRHGLRHGPPLARPPPENRDEGHGHTNKPNTMRYDNEYKPQFEAKKSF